MEYNWKYNIEFEFVGKNKNYYNNHALLDILVNDNPSTSLCIISNYNILKCESNKNSDVIIKIAGNNEPNLSTIYFSEALTDIQKTLQQ